MVDYMLILLLGISTLPSFQGLTVQLMQVIDFKVDNELDSSVKQVSRIELPLISSERTIQSGW